MDILFQYGLQGVLAFGLVGVINLFYKKRTGSEIASDIKLYMLIAFAFAAGFIPADLGNAILTHLKDAVAIALGIHATYTAVTSVGKNS